MDPADYDADGIDDVYQPPLDDADDIDGGADDIDDDGSAMPKPAKPTGPQSLQDIIDATNKFDMLGLPVPEWDELGSAVWGANDADIKLAYKKMSIFTHPDKNRGEAEKASEAFELVKKAFEALSNPDELCTILATFVERARSKEEKVYVPASEQDVEALVRQKRREKELKAKQVEIYKSKLKEKDEARKKRKRQEKKEAKEAKKRLVVDSSSDSEGEVDRRRKLAMAKRKKAHKRKVFF